MFAGEWNVLSRPNNKVVGPNGVLEGGTVGAGVFTPSMLDGLALWLDAIDQNSLLASDGSVIEDGEAVALWSDKSGNSAENCLVLNGVSGNYASTPDSAAVSVPGDIDIRVRVSKINYGAGASRVIIAKYDTGTSQRSYSFIIGSTNLFQFNTSPDGVAFVTATSTISASTLDTDTIRWLRVTRDVDDGSGNNITTFYTSSDGITWTPFGDPVVVAGTTSLFDGSAALTVGSQLASGVSSLNVSGNFYRAQVYDGIDGTTVFDADFTAQAKLATSFTESSSNAATVTINTTGATGARISGARDLYQGTVANRPVFLKYNGEKYGYIATTADYFSTPDSAALDVTSDIDLVFAGTAIDWTPSTVSILVDKATTTGNQYSYRFYLNTSGNLNLAWSPDGTAASSVLATSTVATGFTDGNKGYVRAFLDVDDGGVYKVYFYTSSDGSTWSQLGTTIVGGGTTSIFASTTALAVGRRTDTAAQSFVGRVHLAQVWAGNSTAGGTLRAVFNAQDYTSGTTLTASTGETWTLNGGSHIVQRTGLYFDGVNDYLKSASFSLSQPENVYFVGEHIGWTNGDGIYTGNSTSERMNLGSITSSPNVYIFAGSNGPNLSSWGLRQFGCVAAVFNGASSSVRLDRNSESVGDAGTESANGFTLANTAALTSPENIFASEVIIYDQTPDSINKQDRLALYAGRKWGFST